MSNQFWSRRSGKFFVVSKSPSINKTHVGSSIVPIPYPVGITLDHAVKCSPDVFTDGCNVYHSGSNTSDVHGDEAGTVGGVSSGTVGEKSEPVFSDCSPNVFINGYRLSRSEDTQWMQGRNTTGTMMTTEAGNGKNIKDTGEFDYDFPNDLNGNDAANMYKSLS